MEDKELRREKKKCRTRDICAELISYSYIFTAPSSPVTEVGYFEHSFVFTGRTKAVEDENSGGRSIGQKMPDTWDSETRVAATAVQRFGPLTT